MTTPSPSAITVGTDVIEYGSVAIAAGIDLVSAGGGPARMIRVDDTSTGTRLDVEVPGGAVRQLTVLPGEEILCEVYAIGSSSDVGRVKVFW